MTREALLCVLAALLADHACGYQQSTTAQDRRAFIGKAAASAAASLAVPGPAALAATEVGALAVPAAAASASPPFEVDATGRVSRMPPIAVGAWAWGDPLFWGYKPEQDDDLNEVFKFAVEQNAGLFDTAELYGLGRSEENIRKFWDELPQGRGKGVAVATKFAALPYLTRREDVVNHAKASVERLGGRPIDLYQIHFPGAWANSNYWDGLADAFDQGLVKSVGVSNYGSDAVRACAASLGKRGIPLSTNQIQLSLLYRCPLDNKLIDTCGELGVKVIAYSPLALGFLTGKYSRDKQPSGPRATIANKLFAPGSSFPRLLRTMDEVAKAHGDRPLAQVALNWVRAKGAYSIPGARNLKQLKSNLGTLDWSLDPSEVAALDAASSAVPPYIDPGQSPFPKQDLFTKLQMFDS